MFLVFHGASLRFYFPYIAMQSTPVVGTAWLFANECLACIVVICCRPVGVLLVWIRGMKPTSDSARSGKINDVDSFQKHEKGYYILPSPDPRVGDKMSGHLRWKRWWLEGGLRGHYSLKSLENWKELAKFVNALAKLQVRRPIHNRVFIASMIMVCVYTHLNPLWCSVHILLVWFTQ